MRRRVRVSPDWIVDLDDPKWPPIEVIAESLAHICRFAGAGKGYSVAQHSVRAAECALAMGLDWQAQTTALLHDAHEIVTGDIPRPTKEWLSDYDSPIDQLESSLQRSVLAEHGLTMDAMPMVDRIDAALCRSEARQFFGDISERGWPKPDPEVEPHLEAVRVWGAHEARRNFLVAYDGLIL